MKNHIDICVKCGGIVSDKNLGGRNGKHETICLKCVEKEPLKGEPK